MSKTKMCDEELNLLVVYIEKRTVTTAYNGNVISIFDNGWSPAPGDSKKKIFTDVAAQMSTTRGRACGMRGIESFFYENRPLRVRHRKMRETINENLNKIKGKLGDMVETNPQMSQANMNPDNMNENNMMSQANMNQANMNQANMNQGIEGPITQDTGPGSWIEDFGNFVPWKV